jgi:hypothetical protein
MLIAVRMRILAALAVSAPADASYRDGAWGFFIILPQGEGATR